MSWSSVMPPPGATSWATGSPSGGGRSWSPTTASPSSGSFRQAGEAALQSLLQRLDIRQAPRLPDDLEARIPAPGAVGEADRAVGAVVELPASVGVEDPLDPQRPGQLAQRLAQAVQVEDILRMPAPPQGLVAQGAAALPLGAARLGQRLGKRLQHHSLHAGSATGRLPQAPVGIAVDYLTG